MAGISRKHRRDVGSDEGEGSSSDHRSSTAEHKRSRRATQNNEASQVSVEATQDDFEVEEDDDDDGEFEEEDGENEEEGEESIIARRNQHAQTPFSQNGSRRLLVRQAGVMKRLDLHNFMCHTYLTIEFGPQVNFIIGHNGSGKSAILTAITLALGGKATNTDRGSSAKTFIKEGQQRADIILKLGNAGDEAYQPSIYGETISIERTLFVDGAGSYKLKSDQGKVISTRKEDLMACLDHFMIQADNPLNVLTQDAAKTFLAAASNKDLYMLFIRGTQLGQLTEEYTQIGQHISAMEVQLENKRSLLPQLHHQAKVAKSRADDADAAQKQGDRLITLRKDLAWAYVINEEKKAEQERRLKEKEDSKLIKCHAYVKQHEEQFSGIEDELRACQARDDAEDAQLDAEREELIRQIAASKEYLKRLHNDSRDIQHTVDTVRQEIELAKASLDEEYAKMGGAYETVRQEKSERLETLRSRLEQLRDEPTRLSHQESELDRQGHHIAEQLNHVNGKKDHVKSTIVKCQDTSQRFQNSSSSPNSYTAYENGMERLVAAIEREGRFKDKPLGPFGKYIKVKDTRWKGILEDILQRHLTNFLVTNYEDEQLLRYHMKQTRVEQSGIVRSKADLFDYTAGEPDPSYTTILRTLQFDHEQVKRALINDLGIERSILVTDRKAGDEIMTKPPRDRYNIESCYDNQGYKLGGIVGGRKAVAVNRYQGPPRLTNDFGEYIEQNQRELREAEQTYSMLNDEGRDFSNQLNELQRAMTTLKREKQQIEKERLDVQAEIAKIDDELTSSAPNDISHLEEMRRVAEDKFQHAQAQADQTALMKRGEHEKTDPLVRRREVIDQVIAERDAEDEKWKQQIEALVTKRTTVKVNLEHYQKRFEQQRLTLDQANLQYQKTLADINKMLEQTYQVCETEERLNPQKSVDTLINEMKGLERAIQQAERRQGASIEEIRQQCLAAQKAYVAAESLILDLTSVVKVLHKSLQFRQTRWVSFRQHIAIRAKMMFIYNLGKRGFTGKLKFDHDKGRLDLRVITNDKKSAHHQFKNAKALSGGEKSFSTISLLLTLWDAIQCPVRCLDEFDVFMDAVNRRVAVGMILDSAKSVNEVQHVFITPQDLQGITPGEEVRVTRMNDPTRTQPQGAA